MPIKNTLVILLLAGALSACGFHLRGATAQPLAFETAWVKEQSAAAVARAVSERLQFNGVALAQKPEAAQIVIRLSNARFDKRVLSVSAQTGKVEELELAFRVHLSVARSGGDTLISRQSITVVRDFTFDSTAVLAKEMEESVLRRELVSAAAAQIMRRLEAVN